jgi:FkbM family methyltransferase
MRNNKIYKKLRLKLFNYSSIPIYPIFSLFIISRIRALVLSKIIKILRSWFIIGDLDGLQINSNSAFLKLKNGSYFFFPTDRIDSLNGLLGGRFEKSQTSLMKKYVKKGDTVLDIGSNFGYYTALFSMLVGKKGEVHTFDPLPWATDLLEKNAKMNDSFKNVTINRFGLGEKKGKSLIFRYKWGDSGLSSLRKHGLVPADSFICKIETLDSYVEKKKFKKIDFIKCDIEGAELLAFKGGSKTLAKFSPILFFEVLKAYERDFNYKPEDIYSFLHSLDYDIYYLKNKVLERVNETDGANMWGDYLAIPKVASKMKKT